MFDTISHGFHAAKNHFIGRTHIHEQSLAPALEMVRKSLLEADVDVSVCESLLEGVKTRCLAYASALKTKSKSRKKKRPVTELFISECFKELKQIFGDQSYELSFSSTFSSVMLVGLQGVGKTSTAGKLAHKLIKKKPLLVACDIYRPAAVEQLKVVADEVGVECFFKPDHSPLQICLEAQSYASKHGHEVMIIDTAGRLSIDETLIAEISELKNKIGSEHTLFVVDAMMGQDAVNTALNFQKAVDFDAVIMTKLDGDARGGAALSMKQVTGKPIAFVTTGEHHHQLETFHPEGFSTRVLGMGDSFSLMEDFEKIGSDMDLDDLSSTNQFNYHLIAKVLSATKKLGPLSHLLKKMPMGISALADQASDSQVNLFVNIVYSMTDDERTCQTVITDSRVARIASGCGQKPAIVKQFVTSMDSVLTSLQSQSIMKNLQRKAAIPEFHQNLKWAQHTELKPEDSVISEPQNLSPQLESAAKRAKLVQARKQALSKRKASSKTRRKKR